MELKTRLVSSPEQVQGFSPEGIYKVEKHISTKADLENILPETKPKTLRANLNEVVRSYAKKNNIDFQLPWIDLYRQFYYRNNYNLTVRAQNAKMRILDYAEQEGILEDLMALATEMFC